MSQLVDNTMVPEHETPAEYGSANITLLKRILSYRRKHGSEGERQFIEQVLYPFEPMVLTGANDSDVLGFVLECKPEDAPETPVLWCAHIDTMHFDKGHPRQGYIYDKNLELIYKSDKDGKVKHMMTDCLGADDGAGIWILLEMYAAGVPGTYLFCRGEEKGGIGSSGIKQLFSDWLKQFKWAIEFDRRGTGDIITEMMAGVTCSDEFAKALASKLNETVLSFSYAPDNTGTFTDTCNFRKYIPECTNVSVGYEAEHTGAESLDVLHLVKLRMALIGAFDKGVDLPVVRDPNGPDITTRYGSLYGFAGAEWDDDLDTRSYSYNATTKKAGVAYPKQDESLFWPETYDDVEGMSLKDIQVFVRTAHPRYVTDLIFSLMDEIESMRDDYAFYKDAAYGTADPINDDDEENPNGSYAG
jgi:hypothetical protein